MASCEINDEIFADNLSECSMNSDMQQVFGDISDDSDSSVGRNRTFPLQFSDDEDEGEDIIEQWTDIDYPQVIEPFLHQSGLNVIPSKNNSVSESLNLFLDNYFYEMMVEETNRYHKQAEKKFKDYKKSKKWTDVTIKEFKNFLGLLILMGQSPRNSMDDYWTTDDLLLNPVFPKSMSRGRFRQIWQTWHFSNNDITKHSDRLSKIKLVLDNLVEKFNTVYTPQREISLDESIIPWSGRLTFKVYNASKITKYGLLVRKVCESKSGYICNLKIYCGGVKKLSETIQDVLSPYLGKWYHVFMNNYYNSVEICETLLKLQTRHCGTIRANKLPKCLKNNNLKRGCSVFRRKQDILLQIWQSKKEIRMISSIHTAKSIESHNIDWHTKSKIVKPTCVVEYNKFMKGVDTADKYLSHYSFLRKTKKWTNRAVMYLLNCALFNAYLVHNMHNKTKMTYKKFLLQVVRSFLTDQLSVELTATVKPETSTSTQRIRTPKYDPPGRLSLDMTKHKPEKMAGTGKKVHAQLQCRVCIAHKKKSLTCYRCSFCNIPLHVGECFYKYHTLKKY